MIIVDVTILLVSVLLLGYFANVVVSKSVILSKFFGISQLALGFLLIAWTTSLPEFSVAIISGIMKEGAISAGNVFGANIADILIVLGGGAFFYSIKLKREHATDAAFVLLLTIFITLYFVYSTFMFEKPQINMTEGLVLLLLFLLYIIYATAKRKVGTKESTEEAISKRTAVWAFLLFLVAIAGVIAAAGIAVDRAATIAHEFGVPASIIGATIISIGTCLPEITVGFAAMKKKQYALAVGEALGSTVVNPTLVLGTAAVLNPITVNAKSFFVILLFALGSAILFMYFALSERKLGKIVGAVMLGCYILYLIALISTISS